MNWRALAQAARTDSTVGITPCAPMLAAVSMLPLVAALRCRADLYASDATPQVGLRQGV